MKHENTLKNSKVILLSFSLTLCFPNVSTITTKYLEEAGSFKTCETHFYSLESFRKALVRLKELEIEGTVTITEKILICPSQIGT